MPYDIYTINIPTSNVCLCSNPSFYQDVENEGPEPSDWDRFAAEEYEALVTEESAQVQLQEGSFEDYESDEPVSPSELGNKGNKILTSSLSEKCGKLQSVDEE